MPRFVVGHYGLDAGWCKPAGAAADLFARGGQVGAYAFEVMPDEERPLLYFYTLVAGGGVPAFQLKRDLLYVTLGEDQTPDALVAFLKAQFEDQMPGRSFYAEPEEEFVARREKDKRQQESYMSKKE